MDSAKTFEDFKEILKNYETETFSKFNVYTSPKGFLDEKREIFEGMKLHWKDGLPYFHFGTRTYTCHHGKDKNLGKKQKYAEKKQEKAESDQISQKTYNLTKPSKKLDCPASITITRVYTVPQFKLENPTKSEKNGVAAEIKFMLKNNIDVEGEEVFWFTLPSADAHKNHTQEDISEITEPIDPAVHSKIKEFLQEGKRNALVISELLERFVETELKQNDKKRKCFFPDIPTIKKIIKIESIKDGSKQSSTSTLKESSDCLLQKPLKAPTNKKIFDFKAFFFLKQEDYDVIINVKGHEFKAHKSLLTVRSSVFASIFRNDMKEKADGIVNIEDCDPYSFSDFLDFLYSGYVENLSTENVFSLFTTAAKYDVQDLKSECLEFMKEAISVDTFCDTVELALQHSEKELVELATNFFAKNIEEIIATTKWESFSIKNPIQSNELLIKALVRKKIKNL